MKQQANYGGVKQHGIALPIIMVILVLAALVTLYTVNTSVKEQQVTADQYRSEQAFAAAQAGVEAGAERHNHFEDYTGPGAPEDDFSSIGLSKGSYRVMFCDILDEGDDAPDIDTDGDGVTSVSLMKAFLADTVSCESITNTTIDVDGFKNDEKVGILSVGKPDDASGRRTISVVSTRAPLFSGPPPSVPLTSKGSIDIGANITVINRYGNINAWAGEKLDMSSSAVSTYINDGSLDPDTADRNLLIEDPGATPSCAPVVGAVTASCNKLGNNSDIVDNDANLTNITAVNMFERIFFSSISDVRNAAKSINKFYTDDSFQGETGLIWLEASDGDSPDINVGTLNEPAILVIDVADGGSVKINGGDTFGLIFLLGDVTFVGNPSVTGSMIVTGSVGKSTGNPRIIYDPKGSDMNPEGLGGMRGIEPGTWKDWGYVN